MVMVPTQSINIMDEQSMMTQWIFGFAAEAASLLCSSESFPEGSTTATAAAAVSVFASASLSYPHTYTTTTCSLVV